MVFYKILPMKKIAYIYDENIGYYYYGQKHPMKPHRITLTNTLVKSYNLDKKMDIFKPEKIDISKLIMEVKNKSQNTNIDCPIFDGMDSYISKIMNGSIYAAKLLNKYDRVIHWSGGMHHAKKNESSGFCYLNDIVWMIFELLQTRNKIMYIDIDIHHGDGVEEAFYSDNRVLTISFHKYGDNYFPGTGELFSNGVGKGRGYSLNIPLDSGIDDNSYLNIFEPIVSKCISKFKPDAIIMQCGADSICGDKIGCFNLTLLGHSRCVEFLNQFKIPIIFLGGGGYNPDIVARAWCYETALITDTQIDIQIPNNPFIDIFNPPVLFPELKVKYENKNSNEYLDSIKKYVFSIIDEME